MPEAAKSDGIKYHSIFNYLRKITNELVMYGLMTSKDGPSAPALRENLNISSEGYGYFIHLDLKEEQFSFLVKAPRKESEFGMVHGTWDSLWKLVNFHCLEEGFILDHKPRNITLFIRRKA